MRKLAVLVLALHVSGCSAERKADGPGGDSQAATPTPSRGPRVQVIGDSVFVDGALDPELSVVRSDNGDLICIEMELEKAIESDWLTVEFFGTGRYEGESVGVKFSATGSFGYRICPTLREALAIVPGSSASSPDDWSRIASDDERTQRMVITGPLRPLYPPSRPPGSPSVPDDTVYWTELGVEVTPSASVSVDAEIGSEDYALAVGYCLDEEAHEPRAGMSMRLGDVGIDMDGVRAVLQHSRGYRPRIVQQAIWAVRSDAADSTACDPTTLAGRFYGGRVRTLITAAGLDRNRYPGVRHCYDDQ